MSELKPLTMQESISVLEASNEALVVRMGELAGYIANIEGPDVDAGYDTLAYCQREYDAVQMVVDYVRRTQPNEPRPLEEWGEDYGDCLWWEFPIEEPPYCGSPLASDWPGYHTHFTRFTCPEEPELQPLQIYARPRRFPGIPWWAAQSDAPRQRKLSDADEVRYYQAGQDGNAVLL